MEESNEKQDDTEAIATGKVATKFARVRTILRVRRFLSRWNQSTGEDDEDNDDTPAVQTTDDYLVGDGDESSSSSDESEEETPTFKNKNAADSLLDADETNPSPPIDKQKSQNNQNVSAARGVESIDIEVLRQLRKAFVEADTDGGGGLDMDEFVEAFGAIIGDGLSAQELTNLFMKIDANSDGGVDWDEFIEFILLENKGNEQMERNELVVSYHANTKSKKGSVAQLRTFHKRMIQRVIYVAQMNCYVTICTQGFIKMWKCSAIENSHLWTRHDTNAWLTDCVAMEQSNRLAVASMDRSIYIYDTGQGLELHCQIHPLKDTPMCVGYYCGATTDGDEVLMCGDDNGAVTCWLLQQSDWWFPNNSKSGSKAARAKGLKGVNYHKVHTDIVSHVTFIADVGSVVSSSHDGTVCLSVLDRPIVQRRYKGHEKPVYTFLYISHLNLIASVGADHDVLLWNPYTCITAKRLQGHICGIVAMSYNIQDFQLFTVDQEKHIKVWNVITGEIKQDMIDRTLYHPENTVSAMTYDEKHGRIVTCSDRLKFWEIRRMEPSVNLSHHGPVVAALVNEVFFQVVSASSFEVSVWNINTGKPTFRFVRPHDSACLSALTFDAAGRRLITGADDGSIKMWNFSTGACLRQFHRTHDGVPPALLAKSIEDTEVTSLTFAVQDMGAGLKGGNNYDMIRQYVISTGWDRRVFVFDDSNEDEDVDYSHCMPRADQIDRMHQDDIMCVVQCPPHEIATCGYDGKIKIWSLQGGYLRRSFDGVPPTRSAAIRNGILSHRATITVGVDDIRRSRSNSKGDASRRLIASSKSIMGSESARKTGGSCVKNIVSKEEVQVTSDSDNKDNNDNKNDKNDNNIDKNNDNNTTRNKNNNNSDESSRNSDTDDEVDEIEEKKMQEEKKKLVVDTNDTNSTNAKSIASTPKSALPLISGRRMSGRRLSLDLEAEVQKRLIAAEKEKRSRAVQKRLRGSRSQSIALGKAKESKKKRPSIDRIVFVDRLNCLVACSNDGYLRFWEYQSGKLLGEKQIAEEAETDEAGEEILDLDKLKSTNPSSSLVALAVYSPNDSHILTGDSIGFVQAWDISDIDFGSSYNHKVKTPDSQALVDMHMSQTTSVRAHFQAVSSVASATVGDRQYIVTSSSDHLVLLWTLKGDAVGMFGQHRAWDISRRVTWTRFREQAINKAARFQKVVNVFEENGKRRYRRNQDDVDEHHETQRDIKKKVVEHEYRILNACARARYVIQDMSDIEDLEQVITLQRRHRKQNAANTKSAAPKGRSTSQRRLANKSRSRGEKGDASGGCSKSSTRVGLPIPRRLKAEKYLSLGMRSRGGTTREQDAARATLGNRVKLPEICDVDRAIEKLHGERLTRKTQGRCIGKSASAPVL